MKDAPALTQIRSASRLLPLDAQSMPAGRSVVAEWLAASPACSRRVGTLLASAPEMPWYRDLVSPPGLLSLVRVPLAAAFPFAVNEPFAGLSILAAAALSDVLDGWYARTFERATRAGAVLDPVMDKLFVATVTLTLVVDGKLSLGAALLLGVRDIAELPLVIWLALRPEARADSPTPVKSNLFGKIVTVVQFATVAAAVLASPHTGMLSMVTGILGVFAASSYWTRALRHIRSGRAGPPAASGGARLARQAGKRA